jgi:nuclear pore complex protein Nup53
LVNPTFGSYILADSRNQNLSPESSHFGRRHTRPSPGGAASQPIYVVVFGYPPEKYQLIVEYFKSLGKSTEAEPNTEVLNCFRIGYHEAADAVRAVRKNGEVFAGSWMIGTKWAVSDYRFVLG